MTRKVNTFYRRTNSKFIKKCSVNGVLQHINAWCNVNFLTINF